MELVREFVQSIVTFSILSAFCLHLMPDKKYQSYANFTVGLVYICMILDMLQQILTIWKGH